MIPSRITCVNVSFIFSAWHRFYHKPGLM